MPEEEEEEIGEVYSEGLRSFGAIDLISGNVNEDGVVYIAADSTGSPSIYVGDTETPV